MRLITKKNIIAFFIIGFAFWICMCLLGSRIATRIHPQIIGSSSNYFSYPVENHRFKSIDQIEISSWLIPNDSSHKAIILLNGIGGNRLGLVSRAKYYYEKGFNVLMPDLRGTGESEGDIITFGWQERYDLLACIDFLEKRKMTQISVHGLSLGAATITYSFQENPKYHFVVLESCYDNITNALKNRIEKIPLPFFIFYPMIKFTEMRIEADAEELSPELHIGQTNRPVFILAGDSEKKVKKWETEKLYANCKSPVKDLQFFKGGFHEDFMKRFEEEWKAQMDNWLLQVDQ